MGLVSPIKEMVNTVLLQDISISLLTGEAVDFSFLLTLAPSFVTVFGPLQYYTFPYHVAVQVSVLAWRKGWTVTRSQQVVKEGYLWQQHYLSQSKLKSVMKINP